MKKQTAVEWLEEQRKWSVITNEHIDQAKAMEKEQIIGAFDSADFRVEIPEYGWAQKYGSAEDYYTSTYGQ